MKVEDPRVTFSSPLPPATADAPRPIATPASSADSDAVRLSSNLRLADEAVRAATISGDVRPDVVEKARALLAAGRLGSDPEHLADRMIDHFTQSHDPDPS
jgi:anti-sigma28 factor (negative regulator of flagellin synthesis)